MKNDKMGRFLEQSVVLVTKLTCVELG